VRIGEDLILFESSVVYASKTQIVADHNTHDVKKAEEAMSYELVWEPKGVVKRFFGHVTAKELFRAATDVEGDERFDQLRYVINDFLGITGFSFSSSHVDELAAIDHAAAKTNKRIKLAVIATDPGIIELATQYANSPMNSYPFRIFSTIAAARDWLASLR